MVSDWFRWFPGWVQVEAEGGYPERLFNELADADIPVWGVHRRDEWVRFGCFAGHYRYMRPLSRRACMRMRVRNKHGLPFWRHRYRHRKGLLVGMALYVLILALLAPRIWVIEVSGNASTATEDILAVGEKWGVRLGAKVENLQIKQLQMQGTGELSTLSFITVNPSHCVARLEVREREAPPEVIDLSHPSDLVAACDGLVLQVESRSGLPLVMEGEAVTAGTLLITGRVPTDLGEKLYRAYGEVWAQTRRRITVTVPLSDTQVVPVGDTLCRPILSLFHWDFQLYSKIPLQQNVVQKRTKHYLTIGGVVLPLGITTDYYRFTTEKPFLRTSDQAKTEAKERLAEQEKQLFLPGDYEKQTEVGKLVGGNYVLTATYLCRENIAVEVPIEGVVLDEADAERKNN